MNIETIHVFKMKKLQKGDTRMSGGQAGKGSNNVRTGIGGKSSQDLAVHSLVMEGKLVSPLLHASEKSCLKMCGAYF